VRFVDDFPRTPVGKISMNELSKTYGSVFSA
jgi:non-ribosomal peptide synthetase component E (peptide arylation enzyme)